MCEFISLTPINMVLVHTNKDKLVKDFAIKDDDLKHSKENKEKRGILYYLSSLYQMEQFTAFLTKNDSRGAICADSRTYQDKDLLRAFLTIKQKTKKGNKKNNYFEESKKRLNSITFADKNWLSSGIQLVDFISFVAFAHFDRKISHFDEVNLDRVWRYIKKEAKIKNLVKELGEETIKEYLK